MNETCSVRPVGGLVVGKREDYRPGPEPFRRDTGRITATARSDGKDKSDVATGVVRLNQQKTCVEMVLDAVRDGHRSLDAIQRVTCFDRKKIRDAINKQVKAGKIMMDETAAGEKIFSLPGETIHESAVNGSQEPDDVSAEVEHDLNVPEPMVDSLGAVVETDDGSPPVPNTYVCPLFFVPVEGGGDRLAVGLIVLNEQGRLDTLRIIPVDALCSLYGDKEGRGLANLIDQGLETLCDILMAARDQSLEQVPHGIMGLIPGETRHIYASSFMDAIRTCAIMYSSLGNFEDMFPHPEITDDDALTFSENSDARSSEETKGIEMEKSENDLGYLHERLEHLYRTAQSSLGAFWEAVVELRTIADDALLAKEKLIKVYDVLGQGCPAMGHPDKGGHSDVQNR